MAAAASSVRSAKRRAAAFAALALIWLAGPAPASAQNKLMDLAPSDRELQYGLMAAGALREPMEADPKNPKPDIARPTPAGTAKRQQLRAALAFFGRVYGALDESSAESVAREAARIKSFATALRAHLAIETTTPIEGQTVRIPAALVQQTKDGDKTQQFFRSKDGNILVYTYRWPLKQNPPFEMLRRTLAAANGGVIKSASHSNHDFNVTIDDFEKDAARTRRHQQKMAFASDDRIHALYYRYHDTPASGFVPPPFLAPLREHWTPPREVLDQEGAAARLASIAAWAKDRELTPAQRSDLDALAKDEAKAREPAALAALLDRWTWLTVMRAVAWITQDEFEADNRWRHVGIEGCRGDAKVPGAETVRIVFATNRDATGRLKEPGSPPREWYGTSASEGNELSVGCASVAVPNAVGASTPLTIETVETLASKATDPAVPHFVATRARELGRVPASKSDYELKLVDWERTKVANESRALVVIHGYNTSFEEALLRAALIAATTRYEGRVFLFSWPSMGSTTRYLTDMDGAERSELHLTGFLRAILRDAEIMHLDVVAHSMGSQMLLRSLGDLRDVFYARDDIALGQVVFAAPDLSTEVFTEKIRETSALAERITVYASEKDKALKISSVLRGGTERLGLISAQRLAQMPKLDFIDATTPTSICNGWGFMQMEHSYFVDQPVMLKHIAAVLSRTVKSKSGAKPEDFVVKNGDGQFTLKYEDESCWWKPW
jgi:esterase/lipase superfamily enzyme